MEISYNYMSHDDIKDVAELEKEVFSQPWSEQGIENYLNAGHTLFIVAKHNDKLAGYAALMCAADEGNLVSIAVSGAYRRMGIARELLDIIYENARENDITGIFLEVRKSNEAAIGLYESEGFERVGVRKGFYELPREDALLFMKKMNDLKLNG